MMKLKKQSVFRTCMHPMIVCDRDRVIASSGALKKELENKPLSKELEKAMESRRIKQSAEGGLKSWHTA